MKFKQVAKKYGARVAVAVSAAGIALSSGLANAGLAADVQTSIASAGTEALQVGSYIVGAVATLLVVGLVLIIMRKSA